jgi:hypothetical protein
MHYLGGGVMPTLVKLGRVQIRMFADDHAPPHFHIWTPDDEALVLIEDLVVSRGILRKQDLEVAMAWARDNIDLLQEYWIKLNG